MAKLAYIGILIAALSAVALQIWLSSYIEPLGDESTEILLIKGSQITLRRRTIEEGGGVLELWADDLNGASKALGYAHAKDRLVQMCLLRIISQGRLSELLATDNNTLQLDIFMRKQGFYHYSKKGVDSLSESSHRFLTAYADGVNHYIESHSDPIEFRLVGYHPDPWKPEDSIAVLKIMCYLGLAETQELIEKTVMQSMQDPTAFEVMRRAFHPTLDRNQRDGGILASFPPNTNSAQSQEWQNILKNIRFDRTVVPIEQAFVANAVPSIRSSNNWVIAPFRSASNHSMYVSDPHLNTLQLPAIWYESIIHVKDKKNYVFSISVPGAPALVMGRTKAVAWGFSYGFMDMVDYFIEHCKNETCKRGKQYVPLEKRTETVYRKDGGDPVPVTIYETVHGLLELPSKYWSDRNRIDEGYYLSRAYTTYKSNMNPTLELFSELLNVKTVREAGKLMRHSELSANFLMADKNDEIAYQQGGVAPKRVHNGLSPLPGWDSAYDWNGTVNPRDLSYFFGHDEGFIVTANDYWATEGKPKVITAHMGSWRSNRIRQLLRSKEKLTPEDSKKIHGDLYSLQGEAYMNILRPLLSKLKDEDYPSKKILENWDHRFDKDSKGATLFRQFHKELFHLVYRNSLNEEVWERIYTHVIDVFGHYFEALVLKFDPQHNDLLWHNHSQEEFFLRAAKRALKQDPQHVDPWGHDRRKVMPNQFFSGKLGFLGQLFGIDRQLTIEGTGSTVCQGQLFEYGGRLQSFAPSWRFITDLSTNVLESILPGGPSGNFLSNLYTTDLDKYVNLEYKTIEIKP